MEFYHFKKLFLIQVFFLANTHSHTHTQTETPTTTASHHLIFLLRFFFLYRIHMQLHNVHIDMYCAQYTSTHSEICIVCGMSLRSIHKHTHSEYIYIYLLIYYAPYKNTIKKKKRNHFCDYNVKLNEFVNNQHNFSENFTCDCKQEFATNGTKKEKKNNIQVHSQRKKMEFILFTRLPEFLEGSDVAIIVFCICNKRKHYSSANLAYPCTFCYINLSPVLYI